jgi:hypothetical protein
VALIHITPDIVSLEGGQGRGRGGGVEVQYLQEKGGEGCSGGKSLRL